MSRYLETVRNPKPEGVRPSYLAVFKVASHLALYQRWAKSAQEWLRNSTIPIFRMLCMYATEHNFDPQPQQSVFETVRNPKPEEVRPSYLAVFKVAPHLALYQRWAKSAQEWLRNSTISIFRMLCMYAPSTISTLNHSRAYFLFWKYAHAKNG